MPEWRRHQIYLTARILPHGDPQGKPYYRCIGGFDLHRCYGRFAVRAVRRFIDLLQNKGNARIIREEIHTIQGKYGRQNEEPTIPKVPCPYSTFLVASAITTDIEDPVEPFTTYESSFRKDYLPADIGSAEIENNEGITVIDVTDPEKPSYCFVSIRRSGLNATFYNSAAHYDTPYRVPLSAIEYVCAYQRNVNEELEEAVLAAVMSLDGVPLVTPKMLFEAWPSEYRKSLDDRLEGSSDSNLDDEGSKKIIRPIVGRSPVVPSLIQLITRPAVERGLELGVITDIEDIVWMASNAEMIKELKAIMLLQDPFPDTAIGLLTRVVRTEVNADKVIDLFGFCLLPEQIITLITKQFEDAEVLDLSNMPELTIDIIIKVLPSVPNLRRLVLLGTSITDDEICDLLPKQTMLFRHLEALIHPCFIKYAEDGYPNGFSIISLVQNENFSGAASLPCFTPAQALQAVTDYITSYVNEKIAVVFTSQIAAQAIIGSEVRHSGQKWSQRSIPLFPQHSLRAFKGEGWFFAFRLIACSTLEFPHHSSYAFIKMDPESNFVKKKLEGDRYTRIEDWGAFKVCNLKEFLLNMQEENRPPPLSSAVDNLVHVMEAPGVEEMFTLMSVGEARYFVTEMISLNKKRVVKFIDK